MKPIKIVGKYLTEDEVLKSLSRKKDVMIKDRVITINKSVSKKNDLGNKSYSKIDFLVKQCNYKYKMNY